MEGPLPERFTLSVEVQPADIDELEHVSNLVYLRWTLEAARAHSDARGFEHAAYRALGGIFNVRRHEIDYLAPALVGDTVAVTTWVHEWKGVSCHRGTEIVRIADSTVLARADTTWVFVRFANGRPTRIPTELREAF